jgi:O-antigen ligase
MKFLDRSRFYQLLLVAFVFFLPFRNHISSVIGIILFLFLFFDKTESFATKAKTVFKSKIAVLSLSIYLMHLVGLLYTQNFKYAGLDLEIKLPLLILPFALFAEKELTKEAMEKVFRFFTFGNILAMIVCLIHAVYRYNIEHNSYVFFYNELAYLIHPSYFSMYLGFNVLLIILKITDITAQEKTDKFQLFVYFLLCTFFLVFITLLASKAGILIITILIVGITGLQLLKKKFYLFFYLISLVGVLFFFLTKNTNATTTKRFTDAKKELSAKDAKNANEKVGSSDTRIEVWKASKTVFGKNYLIGVGTGDIKDELIKQYAKNDFTLGVQNMFNCHNQYFQFYILFGIIGGSLFIALIIASFYIGIQSKNQVLLLFLLLFCLNIFIESMLETKAGVEFYAFFFAFLLKNNYRIGKEKLV